MKIPLVLLFVIVLCTAVAAYAYYLERPAISLPSADTSWEEKVEFWSTVIEERGAHEAYAAFSKSVENMPQTSQHHWAHIFGSALFQSEGIFGITVCDARFSYGCYHQFLGDAIQSHGLGTVTELNEKCFSALKESPLSCQHGIGHGILAEIGYEASSLKESLELCRNLAHNDPIGGCYGGVFMEYNMRTMLADTGELRLFTGDTFEPCSSLDESYRSACIYWMPQWWMHAVLGDMSLREKFTEMGNYCRDFSRTPELSRACFEGIGNVVTIASGFNSGTARELCDVAGGDAVQRLLCRSIGANHFGIDVSSHDAMDMCEGLQENAYSYCEAYAKNEHNILNVGALPL